MVDEIEETPVPEGEPPSEENAPLEAAADTGEGDEEEAPADEQ